MQNQNHSESTFKKLIQKARRMARSKKKVQKKDDTGIEKDFAKLTYRARQMAKRKTPSADIKLSSSNLTGSQDFVFDTRTGSMSSADLSVYRCGLDPLQQLPRSTQQRTTFYGPPRKNPGQERAAENSQSTSSILLQRDAQSSNITNHLCVPVAIRPVQSSLALQKHYQERLQSIPQTSSVAIHRSIIPLQPQPSTACVPVAIRPVQSSLALQKHYQERLQSIPQTSSVAIHRSIIPLQQQPSTAHSHFVATSLVHPRLSWHGSRCLHSLQPALIQAASSAGLGCGTLMAPMLQPPAPQQPRLVGLAWPGTAQLLGQAHAQISLLTPSALPPRGPFWPGSFGPGPSFGGAGFLPGRQ